MNPLLRLSARPDHFALVSLPPRVIRSTAPPIVPIVASGGLPLVLSP